MIGDDFYQSKQELFDALEQLITGNKALELYGKQKQAEQSTGMAKPFNVEDAKYLTDLFNSMSKAIQTVSATFPTFVFKYMEGLSIMAVLEEQMPDYFVDCVLDKTIIENVLNYLKNEEENNESKEE